MLQSEILTTHVYCTMLNRHLTPVRVDRIKMRVVLGAARQRYKNRYECSVLDGSERQIVVTAAKLRPLIEEGK